MNTQEIIVAILVVIASIYVARRFFFRKKGSSPCDCCTSDCKLRGLKQKDTADCRKSNK